MLKNFLRQLTKATDIAIVIASALVVLAFLTSDYPTSSVETADKAVAAAAAAKNTATTALADLAIAKQVAEDVNVREEANVRVLLDLLNLDEDLREDPEIVKIVKLYN